MTTGSGGTLLLTRRDVADLLDLDSCIAAVESAFRQRAEGRAPASAVLAFPVDGGGFHVKAAALPSARSYFAAKLNGNFPDNPARLGLPAIQGVVVLCDAGTGTPLAVLDSMELTTLRTAAATAVAARWLARPESATAAILGCGVQGRAQLKALTRVLPLRRVRAFDREPEAAARFAEELSGELGIPITAAPRPSDAVRDADVCVTCTPSRVPLLRIGDLPAGVFIAAVGADSPEKQELDPAILESATVVVDVLEQCAAFGELHHAIEAGVLTRDGVHAELGDVVSRRRSVERRRGEIVVFDSTGTALEDVAAAAVVYERAIEARRGARVDFAR